MSNRHSLKLNLRLDRLLQEKTGLSRKKVKALLDEGRVRVNGKKVVIASWETHPRDTVDVLDEPISEIEAGKYFLKVLFQDKDILVIEKDAGIPCENSAIATKPSLPAIINAYFKRRFPLLKHHYLGLVHRLDQETSGVMVYTLTKEANKITQQFKKHTIDRRYWAIVEGRIESEGGTIDGFLKKNTLLSGGKKVSLATPESGRHAVTIFKVLERYPKATLVEIRLNTGRTHQIRVHMASIGHPLIGDKIYRRPNQGNAGVAFPTFKRQALHAFYLAFRHPITGQKMEYEIELPKDLRKLVDRLRVHS